MGGCTFRNVGVSKRGAKDAFDNLVNEAQYIYGHDGYTGTIAEKRSFILIDTPKTDCPFDHECPLLQVDPFDYSDKLIDEGDARVNDKWGDAGCIELKGGHLNQVLEKRHLNPDEGWRAFIFFGWASE